MSQSKHITDSIDRQYLLQGEGVMCVYREAGATPKPAPGQPGTHSDYVPTEPELFIALLESGEVLAFNGHVDLGTGIQTSLAQIVAEELDIAAERVTMVLGHPNLVPNQGPTIASATIQITAIPLRKAAAQCRQQLLVLAAEALNENEDHLSMHDGVISVKDDASRSKSIAELLHGRRFDLLLDLQTPIKKVEHYKVVGQSTARVDIPDKVRGDLRFVHDLRLPGMLHGRVIRPPYVGRDCGEFVGTSLIAVERDSIAHLPGVVDVIVDGDFVGVVAEREEQAIAAAKQLHVQWREFPLLPAMDDLETTLSDLPGQRRDLLQQGERAPEYSAVEHRYLWSYNMHASIGPSCAVAAVESDQLTVWSGTQNPHSVRVDLHRLMGLDESDIEIIRMEAAGCYGRNCADDVCADAALMAKQVGRPVRVQLSREQEHGWEPKGTAQLMQVRGALTDKRLSHYEFNTRYPSNDAPTLALLLTNKVSSQPRMLEMGDRTAVPPYECENVFISCDDVAPVVRSSWLRGVSALPNSFAHECFIDEMAYQAGADPIAFRLAQLRDQRAAALIEALAERAQWQTGQAKQSEALPADTLRGRGFAYAHYVHSKFPGFGAAMAAWVVDISVNTSTGRITVDRVCCAQDAGLMINPEGVKHQVHGNIIQSLSRSLKEQVLFDHEKVTSLEWGGYPILSFDELPEIDLLLINRPDEPSLGVGESASLPCAPAIANALFDASGVRFYQAPFTPEAVRARLNGE